MTVTEFLLFALGAATSGAIAALAVALYPRWKLANSALTQAAVEGALQPFVAHAIMASYRLSEAEADAGIGRLTGDAKKQLADSAYKLLPERVGEFDVTFVRSVVPTERFQLLVQDAFDRFDQFYLVNHAYFDEAYRRRSQTAPAPKEDASE